MYGQVDGYEKPFRSSPSHSVLTGLYRVGCGSNEKHYKHEDQKGGFFSRLPAFPGTRVGVPNILCNNDCIIPGD
jgi:hypothetical protein